MHIKTILCLVVSIVALISLAIWFLWPTDPGKIALGPLSSAITAAHAELRAKPRTAEGTPEDDISNVSIALCVGKECGAATPARALMLQLRIDGLLCKPGQQNGLQLLRIDPYFGRSSRANHDVLTRYFEYCLLNAENARAGPNVQLCTGGTKPAPAKKCDAISRAITREATASLTELLAREQWKGVLIWWIQIGVVGLLVYALLHMLLSYYRPRREGGATGANNIDRFINASEVERTAHFSPGERVVYRSFHNQLAAVIGTSQILAKQNALEISERVRDTHDYASFCEQSEMHFYRAIADTMVKLSFIGTCIGISISLFNASGLDSAEPLERIQAKFDMYAGLGAAFGTTLVGVSASLLLSFLSDTIERGQERKIRDAIGEVQYVVTNSAAIQSYLLSQVPPPPALIRRSGSIVGEAVYIFLSVVGVIIATVIALRYYA